MASKKISQLFSSTNPPLSGVTAVVHDETTYKSSLSTLRQVLVDSGSHTFTGSQRINGNLTIDGVVPSLIVGTGSFSNGVDIQPEILHVQNSGSYNIALFQANNEYYAQVNIKNTSNNYKASTDLVLTADNGTEVVHYVDLGINSSNYSFGGVGYNNDSYLMNAGKDLYIGTLGGSEHPAEVKLFTMNNWQTPHITLHSVDNDISLNGYVEVTGSMYVSGALSVSGSINIKRNSYIKSEIPVVGTTNIIGLDDNYQVVIGNYDATDAIVANNRIKGINGREDYPSFTFQDSNTGLYRIEENNLGITAGGVTQVSISPLSSSFYSSINVSGSLNLTNNLTVNGITNLSSTSEKVNPYSGDFEFTHSYNLSSILFLTEITDNFLLNLTDISEVNNRAFGFTIIVEQGSTPFTINEFKINGVTQTILWPNGTPPSAVANTSNVFSLSFFRINGVWKVFGHLTTF